MDFRTTAVSIPTPQASTPVFTETHLPPGQTAPPPPPGGGANIRPLSDIRELSEPSIIDARTANTIGAQSIVSRAPSLRNKPSLKRSESSRGASRPPPTQQARPPLHAPSHSVALTTSSSSAYSSTPERSSFYSIPPSSVPQRSSSQTHARRRGPARKTSNRDATPPPPPPRPAFEGLTIPNRGPGRSPVKEAGRRYDAVQSDTNRRVPSRTHVHASAPTEILSFPTYRHPRVKLDLQVSAPLFVGGGSIEGTVRLTIDENERLRSGGGSRRSLALGGISVDLIGFEDVDNIGRKASFLAIGTDLIDIRHPPPQTMLDPPNPLASATETFWPLAPSTSTLQFMLSLPLDTGPPPFQSKHARIRFLLAATVLIRDAGKMYSVRTSHDVHVIPTYDPEKALTSLHTPLTATDELTLRRFGRAETVILTAGLHRQVWVCGGNVFVDVHIANRSYRAVRKVEVSLERDILAYRHSPAATREKSVSQARIFERREQAVLARTIIKAGISPGGWQGLEPYASETRTWRLEIPCGNATVRCGKFFEVRFFLNVCIVLTGSTGKTVAVQLPVTLIHFNSLDVVPNCVAQVARAIEEKRGEEQKAVKSKPGHSRNRSSNAAPREPTRRPSYSQGRAFAAPRQQSIDRQRAARREIEALGKTLDSSPRKFEPGNEIRLPGAVLRKMESISFQSIGINGGERPTKSERNVFSHLAFKTPISERRKRSRSKERRETTKDAPLPTEPPPPPSLPPPLARLGSINTLSNQKNDAEVNPKPSYNFTVVQHEHHRLQPQILGLSTHANEKSPHLVSDADLPRPATGLGFRERMDRARFEVRGVRRKASGRSVTERGLQWWEGVKGLGRGREGEGWI